MSNIGYTHHITNDYKFYIVVIENLNYKHENLHEWWYREHKLIREFAEYNTDKYRIKEVIDYFTDQIVDVELTIKSRCTYYLTKEIPINKLRHNLFFNQITRKKVKAEFTGIQKIWHDLGNIKEEFFHINGVRQGEYTKYYLDGKVEEKYFFVNNKKHGEYFKYHKNGVLILYAQYINDKINGVHKEFFDFSGRIKKQMNYVNNKKNGEYIEYHENTSEDDKIKIICNFKNDKKYGEYKEYYEDSQIKILCNFVNNRFCGEYLKYNNDGIK